MVDSTRLVIFLPDSEHMEPINFEADSKARSGGLKRNLGDQPDTAPTLDLSEETPTKNLRRSARVPHFRFPTFVGLDYWNFLDDYKSDEGSGNSVKATSNEEIEGEHHTGTMRSAILYSFQT